MGGTVTCLGGTAGEFKKKKIGSLLKKFLKTTAINPVDLYVVCPLYFSICLSLPVLSLSQKSLSSHPQR